MRSSRVFINGAIFTSDPKRPYVDAMIVENGRIQWIGKQEQMPQYDFPVTDLRGKRVLPGFVDAHMHPVMLAEQNRQIPCLPPRITCFADLQEEIRKVRIRQGEGQWICGWGCDEGKLLEKHLPDRYELDQICSDAPVCIVRTCLHIRCVNSRALEMAGITRETPDPPGGIIDRDTAGEPTGILRESARDLITAVMPKKSEEERVEDLLILGRTLAAQGITSFCDMGNLEPGDSFEIYEEAVRRGFRQKAAIYYMWEHFAQDPGFYIPEERFCKKRQIRVAGLKLIGDGSISGRTAWTYCPYQDSEEYGMPVCSPELLEQAVDFCRKYSCQLSMHAMGSRAVRRIIERFRDDRGWDCGGAPYLRVEHVTEPDSKDVIMASQRGIAFVTQPVFLFAEIESYLANLGRERMLKTYPVRSMLKKGVQLCLSTDAPATAWAVPSDPFINIQAAVTRRAWDGTDCGSQESIGTETAVELYTRESARIGGFLETGQLKKGYQADFIVLDRDIFQIPPEEIHKIQVLETYISGERIEQ